MKMQRAAAALPAGTTTSQPLRWSTRTLASCRRAKEMLATQPERKATRCRRTPSAGNVLPIWEKKNGGSAEGASCATLPSRPSILIRPRPRASVFRPLTSYK